MMVTNKRLIEIESACVSLLRSKSIKEQGRLKIQEIKETVRKLIYKNKKAEND
ncbi:hypothetical protein ES702_02757 [subsurface metagenome]